MTHKQIENNAEQEKIKAARAALRGSLAHAETLIRHNTKMSDEMDFQALQLRSLAEKCGDVYVPQYCTQAKKTVPKSLKLELMAVAQTLQNGAAK